MGGKGGVTTMRITQVYDSKDARDGALASGMDEGMECCYKQLDAVLAPARVGQGRLVVVAPPSAAAIQSQGAIHEREERNLWTPFRPG
jgi:hypothetical protein